MAGGSRSCFTTADRLNLLAGFQYLILDLRRSASVRSHDDISPEGQGYNNAFGAFHLPAVTLTDRTLWTTMLPGMIAFLVNQVEEDASLSELTLPPPSPLATRGLVVF